jgi:hypothetical protein
LREAFELVLTGEKKPAISTPFMKSLSMPACRVAAMWIHAPVGIDSGSEAVPLSEPSADDMKKPI